jgi:molybdenum cofactor guanylyltransferase
MMAYNKTVVTIETPRNPYMSTYLNNVTGIILAGGRGQRMHNKDKGWIHYQNKPFIEHVLEKLKPQVTDIVISANRNLDNYKKLGYPVVPDRNKNYEGALAGILATLSVIRTDFGLIVPVDAPSLPSNLLKTLLSALKPENDTMKLILAHDGQRLQPLFGVYDKRLAPDIEHYLASGNRKLTEWCLAQSPVVVDMSLYADQLCNINTPDNLAALESRQQN